MTKKLRVGLTGGIASGKSTIARMFEALGAGLVDTDVIAREVVAPGQPGLASVTAEFGPGVLTDEGTLDRAAMRRLVFRDPHARSRLEALLHPLIRAETVRQLEAIEAPYVIVAVPLLVESGFDALVDRVLVVDCPEPLQRARLEARDGVDAAEALAMMRAQSSREARLAAADDVIDNGRDLEFSASQVRSLDALYRSLSGVCRGQSTRAE